MPTFDTVPKIEIKIIGVLTSAHRHEFERSFRIRSFRIGCHGTSSCWFAGTGWSSVFLDVDVAEKAVAWLKAHGVERGQERPLRDTEMVIGEGGERTSDFLATGHCRRCGETEPHRKGGRCDGVPGSTHDWVERTT